MTHESFSWPRIWKSRGIKNPKTAAPVPKEKATIRVLGVNNDSFYSSASLLLFAAVSLLKWLHTNITDKRFGISSSDALFSFCPQFFPAAGTFPMSQLFTSDDQNTRVSASASVLPAGIQGWFSIRWTGLISLLSKGLSGVFSSTTIQRHQFFGALPSF